MPNNYVMTVDKAEYMYNGAGRFDLTVRLSGETRIA
jgi:hypothetical protein